MRKKLDTYFGEKIDTLFDEVIISSEVSLIKPDPKIFRLVLKRLNVEPKETVFIDDAKEYIEGAKKLGIITILFQDNSRLKTHLKKHLSSN